MRHCRRVSDEALNRTERFSQREALQVAHELPHGVVTTFELEADYCHKSRRLTSCDVIARVARHAWVIHFPHVGLLLQPLRQRQSVAPVMVQPGVQRPQPAQRHEAVEWCSGNAEAIGPPNELLMLRLIA